MTEKRVRTGASARRERGRQEMVAAIVDAAEDIIIRDGVEALTIRAVANALGYSPGALYEYFDSKEAILGSLYFEGTGGLDTCCVDCANDLAGRANAIDTMIALGQTYRNHALENPEMYRLVFGGIKTPPTPNGATVPEDTRSSFGLIIDVVRRGIGEGSITDMPPDEIAYAIWSAVHGFVSLEISDRITGGEGPGTPAESDEEGMRQRDRLFNSMLRQLLYGFANKERDAVSATCN